MWESRPLGAICDFQGGTQPPKKVFISEPAENYIRLLQIRDFKSDDKAVYIPISKKNRTCQSDDIMIGRYGASVGQIHRGKAGAYNVALIKTIPNEELLDRDFFYHYLVSDLFQKPLMNVSARSAQAGFSKADISDFDVPLPPLDEQKRIVAILDEAFAGIDQAITNTEKNIQNAKELFESYLNNIFTQKGEGWRTNSVGDIADCKLGKMLDKRKNKGTPAAYLRNLNVRWFKFQLDDVLEMKFEASEVERYSVQAGDLMICEGGYPGRAAIWQSNQSIFYQKALHRVRFHEPFLAEWLLYTLYMLDQSGKLSDHFTGAGIQHFTGKALKALVINYPDCTERKHIISNISKLHDLTQKQLNLFDNKLAALTELKQSLLQKAFAGELTADIQEVA